MNYENRKRLQEYNEKVELRKRKCVQCGTVIAYEWILNEVCGKCCRANHLRTMYFANKK